MTLGAEYLLPKFEKQAEKLDHLTRLVLDIQKKVETLDTVWLVEKQAEKDIFASRILFVCSSKAVADAHAAEWNGKGDGFYTVVNRKVNHK